MLIIPTFFRRIKNNSAILSVKAGIFYSQLLACFFLMGVNSSHANTHQQESLDFIYVNSNIGEAAGGHTALRIGEHVFHYQFFPNGHFLLVRDSWQQFFFFYHKLFNRSIYLASLSLTPDDYYKIKNHFTQLLIEQQQSLQALKEGDAHKRLIDELIHQNHVLTIPRLGLFSVLDKIDLENQHLENSIKQLKTDLPPSFLKDNISQVKKELQLQIFFLNSHSTEQTISHIQQTWDFLAALHVLEQSSLLNPESIFYPLANETPLNHHEKEVLKQYSEQLKHSILSLLYSSRPDKGTALLLQIAKYQVIILSLTTGYLTTLDPFPEPVKSVSIDDEERIILETLYEHVKKTAQAQRKLFFAETQHYEIAWSLLESSRARFYELDQGIEHQQVVRLSSGTLIPSRTGTILLDYFPVKVSELQSLSHKIEIQQHTKTEQIQTQLRYHITNNNCATALIESVNSAFKNPLEVKKSLGAWLPPNETLSFIPFIFYQKILAEYDIKHTHIIPSRRLKNLADLYQEQPDNTLMIWLRESNVLSSTLYEVRKEDTPFLFFTDEQVLSRPVFGLVNFSYAAIHGVMSLFTFPMDRGNALYESSRGMFFSLPELAFWNIRKGTYGHTYLTPTEASP